MATLKRALGGSKRAERPLSRLPASSPQRSSLNLAHGKPADYHNTEITPLKKGHDDNRHDLLSFSKFSLLKACGRSQPTRATLYYDL